MRTYIPKKVNAECNQRDIAMCVVPEGSTTYLQAGHIEIYNVFEDNLSSLIERWKHSEDVELIARGNPRPPSIATVRTWVRELSVCSSPSS
ncbi:hypothetical protein PPTG_20729 [Phytophthora nicotianae INRA-310]|uniref:DDE-1 domain-containing protein n=1 Tax=Phytophthora nicotianae (strain INRA-310) TaxID=761204 RepID=W2RFB9_PHYN3|nr:hypothetical protein PPTG_20729 [Phytophthora nicotianae INRA-310]ETN23931.1 hypothetical protein PPTG_20729 [Phytophthora nicotianae INRA-310]